MQIEFLLFGVIANLREGGMHIVIPVLNIIVSCTLTMKTCNLYAKHSCGIDRFGNIFKFYAYLQTKVVLDNLKAGPRIAGHINSVCKLDSKH